MNIPWTEQENLNSPEACSASLQIGPLELRVTVGKSCWSAANFASVQAYVAGDEMRLCEPIYSADASTEELLAMGKRVAEQFADGILTCEAWKWRWKRARGSGDLSERNLVPNDPNL